MDTGAMLLAPLHCYIWQKDDSGKTPGWRERAEDLYWFAFLRLVIIQLKAKKSLTRSRGWFMKINASISRCSTASMLSNTKLAKDFSLISFHKRSTGLSCGLYGGGNKIFILSWIFSFHAVCHAALSMNMMNSSRHLDAGKYPWRPCRLWKQSVSQ